MADTDRIPTNMRMLLILEILGESDRPMTATEISTEIGLPKQTVHRLCATLEAERFLARIGPSKAYSPAQRLRDLGTGLVFSSRSQIARHQVLVDLSSDVGETVNFAVPEDTGMHYLDRVETDWPFRIQLPVGSNVPFHCTASGKTYLASLKPAARRAFVAGLSLPALTPRTLTDADRLLADLKGIAKRGYALDNEEFMDGMVAIAVPVHDRRGRYVASLAFHGPVQRISIEAAVAHKDLLIESAARLSKALMV